MVPILTLIGDKEMKKVPDEETESRESCGHAQGKEQRGVG